MSHQHRRRQTVLRRQPTDTVPTWAELSRLDAVEVQELAERMGIEYTTRSETLSAINKAR